MTAQHAGRLQSLDAFRGATVAAMLLVNNPGSWSSVWPPLRHAEWHGWTATDLIFPFFLFIVGMTTELSRKEPKEILRRGALIILAGLLLNAFPFTPERFASIRVTGVLQRIGVVYMATAFIARSFSRRSIVAIVVILLGGYWVLIARMPLSPPEATMPAMIDRALIGEEHLWAGSRTWDPEGLLSTSPAIATSLIGLLLTRFLREQRVAALAGIGALMAVAGWAWGFVFPINKNLWTSSYVLLTAGLAAILLALFEVAYAKAGRALPERRRVLGRVDAARSESAPYLAPFVVFGMNPLIAFLGSGLMARTFGIVRIDGRSLQSWSYTLLFKPYFDPQVASFLWALSFVLIWLLILWLLQRRGIVLKV
jgi:predicted acyltransferase